MVDVYIYVICIHIIIYIQYKQTVGWMILNPLSPRLFMCIVQISVLEVRIYFRLCLYIYIHMCNIYIYIHTAYIISVLYTIIPDLCHMFGDPKKICATLAQPPVDLLQKFATVADLGSTQTKWRILLFTIHFAGHNIFWKWGNPHLPNRSLISIYIYIYIQIYIYILYIYIYTYNYIYTYIYTYIYCVYVYIYMYTVYISKAHWGIPLPRLPSGGR